MSPVIDWPTGDLSEVCPTCAEPITDCVLATVDEVVANDLVVTTGPLLTMRPCGCAFWGKAALDRANAMIEAREATPA